MLDWSLAALSLLGVRCVSASLVAAAYLASERSRLGLQAPAREPLDLRRSHFLLVRCLTRAHNCKKTQSSLFVPTRWHKSREDRKDLAFLKILACPLLCFVYF